jgi:oleate hydratase
LLAATGLLRDGAELDIPGPAFIHKLLLRKLDKTKIGELLREYHLLSE